MNVDLVTQGNLYTINPIVKETLYHHLGQTKITISQEHRGIDTLGSVVSICKYRGRIALYKLCFLSDIRNKAKNSRNIHYKSACRIGHYTTIPAETMRTIARELCDSVSDIITEPPDPSCDFSRVLVTRLNIPTANRPIT